MADQSSFDKFELGLIVEAQKTVLRDDLQAVYQMLTKLIQSLQKEASQ